MQRYQQEDAHEFLQCLLDRLDNFYLMNRGKGSYFPDDNLVQQVFGGRLVSKVWTLKLTSNFPFYLSFL